MGNILRIARSDVKHLFANAMSIIIAVGLVVMPSIFAWYNVIACWNVFDNTGNLTVAVASVDEGYESDLVPLRVNVGEQVVSALRANEQIDWTFTDEADAIDGARSGRYYAAVVIPKEFSRDMLTFYSDEVEHAKIVYYANEKKSAIAPKITDQGADSVSREVNKVFAEELSAVALGLAQSLSRYADEADVDGRIGKLAEHVRTMADGADRTAAVLEQYALLATSARTLAGDSAKLVASAQAAIDDVSARASEGSSAAGSILDALGQSVEDLSRALEGTGEGFGAVSDSVDGLFAAADSGSKECAAQMRVQADAADGRAAGYRSAAAELAALRDKVPEEYRAALDSAVAQMNAQADLMEGIRDNLRSAADKLEAGNANAQAEREEVKALAAQAQEKADALAAEFDANVRPGLERLAADAASLATSVDEGLSDLRAAGAGLADSAGSVGEVLGAAEGKISEAASELRGSGDKLRELADGMDEALATGDAEQLRRVLGADTQLLSRALAAPVGLERTAVFPVENFGSAMAPFYTTLALFIGSLLILVAVKPTVPARVRATLANPKPRELFLGRFAVMGLLSLAQTTVMGLGNLLFLQVQVAEPLLFMLCFWTAGLVFTFFIYALVAAFANLGKAVAVLLLIVQVTGCGGSFPLQLLPPFIQGLSPWLPATHVVNAMRAAMFGVCGNDFWVEMGLLLLFLIPAALIGLALRKPLSRFMTWYVEQVESSKLIG